MAKILGDQTVIKQWERILTDINHLKGEVETARTTGILKINFENVDKADQELGELILNNPTKAFGNLDYALRDEEIEDVHIDLVGLTPINQRNIVDLRTKHLGELSSIEGIVVQVTSVNPRLMAGAFQCQKCGAIIKIEQQTTNTNSIRIPTECYEEQSGCGRITSFVLVANLSTYADFQKILITNPYYEAHRRELEVHCYKEHCNKILPGETITINGQYCVNVQDKKLTQDTYFFTYGFESPQSKNLEFTEDEKKQADKLAQSPELWKNLLKSFAPSIYGNLILKESLLLQQFGGVWYDLPDGTTKRGSIHILFVGDPGTVKSTLMQASCRIAPIFTKASGRGATVAGITAGAVRDPLSEGWMLQAGALVRANSGTCYLDEFDKLPKEVQGCLHTPMEQGVVEQSKMGSVNQTLSARTSILASMNPKEGRFDGYTKNIDQVDLDPALLSRVDLTFAIEDKPNKDEDKKIVDHIHKSVNVGTSDEERLTADFLRKYVHSAQQVKPIISDDIHHLIVEWFIDSRGIDDFHINYRHYEAIRRLTEAGAKARLSRDATADDVNRAIRLFKHSLDTLGVEDIDAISIGITKQQKYILRAVESILPATWQDILRAGFNEDAIKELISKGYLNESKDEKVFLAREK